MILHLRLRNHFGRFLLCSSLFVFNICQAQADPAISDLHSLIDSKAKAIENSVIEWRRHIHEHPELSNREFNTAKMVADHLKKLGLNVKTGVAHTGVVAVLKGGLPGPVVALRADMDALPVVEETGLPYASRVKSEYLGKEVGVMHACGHDTHVAILMGVASVLAEIRDQVPGGVKFIFQPAEEGAPAGEEGGARLMVEEKVLKNPDVNAVFGLHISQRQAAGQAGYRTRGAMASAQAYTISIKGSQTHGAMPWAGVDPIVVGAQIVTALQTIISRNIDITKAPAVVTVGTFHAGVRSNIIPETAELSGTIRTFDPADMKLIHQKVTDLAVGIGESMGAVVDVNIEPGYPVTFNNEELAHAMLPSLQRVFGFNQVQQMERITGAEDFSFFQEKVPGLYFYLGGRPPDIPEEKAVPNHSPRFYIDENALVYGVRAMSTLAVDYLTQHR